MRKSAFCCQRKGSVSEEIDNRIIKVKVNNYNKDHFEKLGYKFFPNEFIFIPVKHLPDGSGYKIEVTCFYCGMTFYKSYRRYLEGGNKICCNNCKSKKMMETSVERYGYRCSLNNADILEKSKKTTLKNFGVEFPFQNKDILKRCRESIISNGTLNNKNVGISSQQRYLYSIYGGDFNKSIFPYYIDILFDNGIYFEYDGSGHELCVAMGHMTRDQFMDKEFKRRKFLSDLSLKEFRIICEDDVLPEESELIRIRNRAFHILLDCGFNHYYYVTTTKSESFEV